jgi:hypothetical protein
VAGHTLAFLAQQSIDIDRSAEHEMSKGGTENRGENQVCLD